MLHNILVWVVLSGCSTVKVEGRVVDGLSGEPVAGPYRMRATAVQSDLAMSCQFFDTEVGADGKFTFDRLCPGTAYKLETDKEDLWLVEVDEAPDGGWGTPTDLTAWRVPKASGLYTLSKGELVALRTDADVKKETILGTEQTVRYPNTVPTNVALVGADDYLVQVGKAAVDELKFYPLVPSGIRKFGKGDIVYTMEPWVYLGMKFSNDTTFEEVKTEFDAAKVIDKAKGDRKARYVSGAALAEGRYAILKDDDRRMTIVDFGKPPAPEAAPAAP